MLANCLITSITLGAIIGIFGLLSPLFHKKYQSRCYYFIWLFIALQLVIPIHINWSFAPLQLSPIALSESFQKQVIAPMSDNAESVSPVDGILPSSTGGLQNKVVANRNLWLPILWGIGFLLFLGYHLLCYFLFLRQIRPWCRKTEIMVKVPVFTCKKISTPMLVGFFKPRILLPHLNYDDEELAMILLHEGTHYKRRDLLYKLLLLIANAIHWFNPLVYVMRSLANKDLEHSCDELVIKNQDINYRSKYSSTILNTASGSGDVALATYFRSDKRSLKRRITNILTADSKGKGISLIVIAMLLFLVSATAVAMDVSIERFFAKLDSYLPSEVISDFDTFKENKIADGGTVYIWSKWNDETDTFNHDLQVGMVGKELQSYHYKDYGFVENNLASLPISLAAAGEIAQKFATDYIEKGDVLNFKSTPYENNLYDPGHVESFVAKANNKTHVIMVNLDYGYIVEYAKDN